MSNLKIYKASAGSGKTYTLAMEYIKELLLRQSINAHRHILAVTFTKDATGEMKDRILAELYGLAFDCADSEVFMNSIRQSLRTEGRGMADNAIREKARIILYAILHDYSRLHITTIDSFFQKVLRNLARELGRSSRFNLEMNSSKVLAEAVTAMIESANEKPQLLDWLTTYIEDKLDEGSNWRIDREILSFSKCIFDEHFQEHEFALSNQLNSNPGIFGQILTQHNKIQNENRIFFRKVYDEIQTIMKNGNLELADFSRNGTVINFFKKLAGGDFATANAGSTTVIDCSTDPGKWAAGKSKRKADIEMLAAINLMPLLNQTLNVLRKYNTSRMITQNLHQLGLIWDITNEISDQNRENNRFMLADTALFLNRMIDDSDTSFIYEKIGAEIRHVMIDEFQDTSRLQWKNFKSLLSNILASNYFSLIVGDVKQSIYRWRNGDWSILNGIEKELGANAETLAFNFRSENVIVDFNNLFFVHAADTLDKKFYNLFKNTSDSPFKTAYNPDDVVQRTYKKEDNGFVSVDFIQDKIEDATYEELMLENLLEQIRILHEEGILPGQICILSRTNRQIIKIAEFLAAQKETCLELASENYLNIVSNEAFQLNSSPSVRIIIEALRMIADPDNPVFKAQLEYLLQPYFIIHSDEQGNENETVISIIESKSRNLPLFELIGYIFRLFQLERINGQSNYMFTFYDAVSNYLNEYQADIPAFLKYWNEELQFKSVPSGTAVEGIRAMTIHKSKGLQFHTVLLPYCDWDLYPEKSPVVWCGPKDGLYDLELLPVKYTQKMYDTVFLNEYESETGQSWMDNLNLLYVAFTRAEHNLLILAKNKKKLASKDDIKNISDLLLFSINELGGYYDDEKLHFSKGHLDKFIRKEKESDNLLKKTVRKLDVSFVSKAFSPDKSIFKQSNKSREFVSQESSVTNEYLSRGNIMHALFSYIDTLDDIEKAVNRIYYEGLIRVDERVNYIKHIQHVINSSEVESWFSDQYQVYNECAIIVRENGIITTKRPDRVLINSQEAIIIDYKFGEKHPAHQKQMIEYIRLMTQLTDKTVKAYLWYVEQNEKKIVSLSDK